LKILVIDDEKMIRDLAEKILKRAGYEVLLAENGTVGIDLFSKYKDDIHLIILDIYMEGLSGIDTLRQLKEISSDIPCIISSGNPNDLENIPAELNKNLRFLGKPYRAHQLTDIVKDILVSV